jgi:hypothetical protein
VCTRGSNGAPARGPSTSPLDAAYERTALPAMPQDAVAESFVARSPEIPSWLLLARKGGYRLSPLRGKATRACDTH